MTQNTNLNISPYFDDFDKSKNYNKVLFKPGYPVQSRELTTLQTILQNQIDTFGQYFFKEGSIIIPGGTTYDSQYSCVRLDPSFLNIPVNAYTDVLVNNNIKIKGEQSGVIATVVNSITEVESIDKFNTLYVKYSSSGTDGVTKVFQDGENLITLGDIDYGSTKIAANSSFAKCIEMGASKMGCSASLNEGIYFIRGYFVQVAKETIILDQYTNSPSYKVGLAISENIVTPSLVNNDLYDNAKGFSNEAAPGADRFQIVAKLSKKLLTDPDDKNFIELIRLDNGTLKKFEDTNPEFAYFEDALARRTYDESGDYYVRPFAIDLRESLNDRISNRGLYLENQLTQNGNTPTDDIYCLQASPGKAYVKGFEIQKDFTSAIDVVKPRTTKTHENISLPIKIGNIVTVNNVYGSPKIGFTSSTTYAVELRDKRVGSDGLPGAASTAIGNARVYDWQEKNVTTNGISSVRYDLRVFDIQTYTKITTGLSTNYSVGDYIEGKYSGATGTVKIGINNTTSICLTDVNGKFQINEPLIQNGNDIGRNVGVVTDYAFEDVKSVFNHVGVNTFSADLELSNLKPVLAPNIEYAINAPDTSTGISTVKCGAILDWRGRVKVGDIVTYIPGGNTELPVYNEVSSIGAGGTSFQVRAIANVAGIATGAITSTTPTGLEIATPALGQGNDSGYRIPFPQPYVSTVNVLDTSMIVRKQLDALSSAAGIAVFDIGDFGDDNLYWEPYDSDEFILNERGGGRIALQPGQVTINGTLKTVTITGLTGAVWHTLTAAAKRSTLASKEKNIIRCSELIVRKSKFDGSGIGTTNFNDGLNIDASGNVIIPANYRGYGSRVQDREICLNRPDVIRVLGVFESNDITDPQPPTLTASNRSSDFDQNNVTIGEQFIGNNSGALARVVKIVSSNSVQFVYENDKQFEIDEVITLKTSGIIGTINLIIAGDRNIISNYTLDSGHRKEFVDYGRIIRNQDAPEPTRKLKIFFDYFDTKEVLGSVECVNSYSSSDYTDEIPFVIDQRASDFIDLRPRVAPWTDTADSGSPFAFGNRDFTGSGSESVVSNKTIIVDYDHYLGRIDRLYLTRDGIFELKKGEPAIEPKSPLPNDEGFEVAIIRMDPYVLNASTNAIVKLVNHKRYTMRDIGSIADRVKNLENYTTLNLLETDTKNLSIKDPNTGLDKFKSGFYVDNFRNHASHNFSGQSQFDIDLQKAECRPRSVERPVALVFETKSSTIAPLTTDYRFTSDFDSDNIVRGGPGLTLKYDVETFIDQPLATRVENLNPFAISSYAGTLELTPDTDYWIDEIVSPPETISFGDGIFDSIAQIMGVDDRENGGMASGLFNTTEQIWGAVESTTNTSETLVNRNRSVRTEGVPRSGRRWRDITTITDTIRRDTIRTDVQSGIERDFGLELGSEIETINLGPKVTSTEIIFNCRTRNIEVLGTRLKPNTKYYVFMENVDVTEYCVPKQLPITMVRGSFETGDIISSPDAFAAVVGQDTKRIRFRAAQMNHKTGPFNNPVEKYATEPYTNTSLTSSYSATSPTVNVDTFDLSELREPDRLGCVRKGMRLSNAKGTAEATVSDLSLISDEVGTLIFSLHIPDPSIGSNPKFTTGLSTIKVTSSPTNASILDPGESTAQTNYLASGFAQYSTSQTLSIKTPQVERVQIGQDQPISRVSTELLESTVRQDVTVNNGRWMDPLAQSFIVPADEYPHGMFLTGGEVYFKTVDDSDVAVQIRELDAAGRPSQTILPFGETKIIPGSVAVSDNGTVGTGFTFSAPVYLRSDGRYALTLITPKIGWNTFITRMGEVDLISNRLNDKQPTLGSLFKSQNNQLWTESQTEDLKFKLFKAKFAENTPSAILLTNHNLPMGKIRKQNPVTAYAKRTTVSVATTVTKFEQGTLVEQTDGSGILNTGKVFSSGGPLDVVAPAASLSVVANSGIGLTPAAAVNVDYANVGFTALSGNGSGAQATVRVNGGAVTTITVTNAGNGYAVGDLLLMDNVGLTGSGVRAVVGVVTYTDRVVLDNVNKTIAAGIALTAFNKTGAKTDFTASQITAASTDPVRDGVTLEISHKNHGMHASTNKVKIDNFVSDYAPLTLSEKIEDSTTVIKVNDASILANFEGSAVSASNKGYVKIGGELISFEAVNTSTNELSTIVRAVDNSLKTNHSANDPVEKYEFNEVSLRKINKTHDISDDTKTFDKYYITLSDTTKMFGSTKAGGGKSLQVSQNIPFEAINPKINTITPTGTNVSARIKTTSGTSISGNEASFVDKGYEPVALNKLNVLDSPRIVASKTNEYELMSEKKSFALELTLSTTNADVSPMIDLDTCNVIGISNLVNKPVSDYVTDSRPRIQGLDPNSGIYETNRIDLEFPANSIQLQFDGNRDATANIIAMYKLFRNDGNDSEQIWIPFNSNGLPDKTVASNQKVNSFSEYKFTAENTPQFNGFQIKVIMESTNQAKAPRIKNLRAIALRSFSAEPPATI